MSAVDTNLREKKTKKQSWKEAATNTGCAFFISLMAHWLIVSPMLQWWVDKGNSQTTIGVAFFVTLFYTILSLGRNYIIIRRHEKT